MFVATCCMPGMPGMCIYMKINNIDLEIYIFQWKHEDSRSIYI